MRSSIAKSFIKISRTFAHRPKYDQNVPRPLVTFAHHELMREAILNKKKSRAIKGIINKKKKKKKHIKNACILR